MDEAWQSDAQLAQGLDAAAWIKLSALFKCCGAAVTVQQVFTVDQLALSIRRAIEEECGLRDPSQPQLKQHQQRVELASLEALQAWDECHVVEPTSEQDFLCCWPSLNVCSVDHLLAGLRIANLNVEQLVHINSDQQVLDVIPFLRKTLCSFTTFTAHVHPTNTTPNWPRCWTLSTKPCGEPVFPRKYLKVCARQQKQSCWRMRRR